MKCPECGNEVTDNVAVCPSCGFEINPSESEEIVKESIPTINATSTVPAYKNKKYIGIVLCIVACSMLIVSVTRINNDTYSFYKQHYKECMEGYVENNADADDSSALFSGTYRYITSNYEDMLKYDKKKIWGYRIQAITLCFGGVACGVIGYKFIKGEKANGISKVS